VVAVTGLSTLGHTARPADLGAPGAFVNDNKCSDFYGQRVASDQPPFQGQTLPYAVCGYTPAQLRGTYGLPSTSVSRLGQNSTVAIVDAFDSSMLRRDANTYAQRHNEPGLANQFKDRSVPEDVSKADDCGGNGWYGEQALDVEAVHGMAPGANILYYGAASCFDDDLLASLSQIVHDNDASIVSNSWGEFTFIRIKGQVYSTIDATIVNAYESVFKQGAAQGIGFYFSSGDSGDEAAATGIKAPDFPTEDPWVTSVGGTSVAINAQNTRIFETGWGTAKYALSNNAWTLTVPFLYGAGGGFTVFRGQPYFERPAYQNGVVPARKEGRGVPDIGLDSDPTTGMLIGETQSFPNDSRFGPAGVHYGEFRIGGTSLACPLMAGLQATAQRNGGRVGFANPLIYSLAGTPAYYDVTPQGDPGNVRADFANGINNVAGEIFTVRTFNQDSSLETAPGWDEVTGVGAPTAQYLAVVGANH
jgi:subtilase family serine protease